MFEENEEFVLTIDQSSSLNGVIIGSPNTAVVNISDNDGKKNIVNIICNSYIYSVSTQNQQ